MEDNPFAQFARPSGSLRDYALSEADRLGLDSGVVDRMLNLESGYKPDAVSTAGAFGPAQLMPATARELAQRYGGNPNLPRDNIRLGLQYLRENLDRFDGDYRKAIAAYQTGPGNVERFGGPSPYSDGNMTNTEYADRILGGESPEENQFAQFAQRSRVPHPDESPLSPSVLRKQNPTTWEAIKLGFNKGAKGLMVTWDYLANQLEQAITGDDSTTRPILEKSAREYAQLEGDPRVAEVIRRGDQAEDWTGAATEMGKYLLQHPGLVAGFLAEQVPAMVASAPAGGFASTAAGSIARRAALSAGVESGVRTGAMGAAFNATQETLASLGGNYAEGMQKFNDHDQAVEYSAKKTAAEAGPNAIAGAFLWASPFKGGRIRDVAGNVALQSQIQGAGGAIGAVTGAAAVGEEAGRGQILAEYAGESLTAPIDVALGAREARAGKAAELRDAAHVDKILNAPTVDDAIRASVAATTEPVQTEVARIKDLRNRVEASEGARVAENEANVEAFRSRIGVDRPYAGLDETPDETPTHTPIDIAIAEGDRAVRQNTILGIDPDAGLRTAEQPREETPIDEFKRQAAANIGREKAPDKTDAFAQAEREAATRKEKEESSLAQVARETRAEEGPLLRPGAPPNTAIAEAFRAREARPQKTQIARPVLPAAKPQEVRISDGDRAAVKNMTDRQLRLTAKAGRSALRGAAQEELAKRASPEKGTQDAQVSVPAKAIQKRNQRPEQRTQALRESERQGMESLRRQGDNVQPGVEGEGRVRAVHEPHRAEAITNAHAGPDQRVGGIQARERTVGDDGDSTKQQIKQSSDRNAERSDDDDSRSGEVDGNKKRYAMGEGQGRVEGRPIIQPGSVDAAAHEAASSPLNNKTATKAQILADNAELGHFSINGIHISIENPAGSVRKDLKNDPPRWSRTMTGAHYGRIKGTKAADGDLVDVFVKEGTSENWDGTAFVIDQEHANGRYDEAKVVLGVKTKEEALALYKAQYDKGAANYGAVTPMDAATLKRWFAEGDTTKRAAQWKPDAPALSRRPNLDVNTKAFQDWFKGSKVVDENGDPLVVYHGTTKDFTTFDEKLAGTNTRHPTSRLGFWFTASPDVAGDFTSDVDESVWPPKLRDRAGAKIMPAYLSINNPYQMTVEQFREINGRPFGEEFEKDQPEAAAKFRNWIDANKARLIKAGHDGIKVEGNPKYADTLGGNEYSADAWVAFRPEQIKSAIGNRGTYDPNDPDITHSRTNERTTGLPIATVESHVADIRKGWGNAPNIEVVATPADLPFDTPADARGAIVKGKVWLVASNLDSRAEVELTAFHELFGHYGIRGVLGERIVPSLLQFGANNPSIRDAAAKWRTANPKSMFEGISDIGYKVRSIEEALAEIAQKPSTQRLIGLRKFFDAIERALRAIGLDAAADWVNKATDAQVMRLLADARAFVEGKAYTGEQAKVFEGALSRTNEKSTEPFYSELSRQVAKLPMQRADAKQWKATIAGLKGVKKDEIFWSGLDDWLDTQTGKIERAAILDYLAQNGARIEETELGGDLQANLEKAERDLVEELVNNHHFTRAGARDFALDAVRGELTESQALSVDDNPKLRELVDAIVMADAQRTAGANTLGSDTKFSQYQLPGGKNYRELLLTLPAKEVQQFFIAYKNGPTMGSGFPSRAEAARELADTFPGRNDIEIRAGVRDRSTTTRTPENFRSSHFDQPNILAHIRFNERVDADGKRVLFVEEFQADKGQLWRQLKTKIDAGTATEAERKQFAIIDAMPFNKTEAWVALAMKRMIRYAAENGFDRVAWTTGEQQTSRYWSHPVIEGAVGRWHEVTKPESIRELSENVLGRKMASAMSLEPVDGGVLAVLKHNQVVKAIVSRIPVDVVNVLSENRIKPEQLLRNGDVVFDRLPVDDRSRAATAIGSAIRETSAAIRAKLGGLEPGGRDFEILPTLRASDLGPRELAGLLDPVRLFHGHTSGSPKSGTTTRSGTESLSGGEGRKGANEQRAAELASLLNAHAEIIHGREGLLQQGFEVPPSEGMKAFYDTIIPNIANDILRRFGGGRVGEVNIQTGNAPAEVVARYPENKAFQKANTPQPHPGFDITSALRESAESGLPLFSRKDPSAAIPAKIGEVISDLFNRPGVFGPLSRSLQTQYHKATKNAQFAQVWRRGHQMFQNSSSAMTRPAEAAPTILPKFDVKNIGDAVKAIFGHGMTNPDDLRATADVLNAGTLLSGADPLKGRVWTVNELRSGIQVNGKTVKLTDTQIKLYLEARAAIDSSLTETATAEAWVLLRRHQNDPRLRAFLADNPIEGENVIPEAFGGLIEQAENNIQDLKLQKDAAANLPSEAQNAKIKQLDERIEKAEKNLADLKDSSARATEIFKKSGLLKKAGYTPLMRFGKYRVAVTWKNASGEDPLTYVTRYESAFEANRARRKLEQQFPAKDYDVSEVEVTNEDEWKIYKGVNPETVMLFAKEAGVSTDDVMQKWYKEAVSNRSALRQLVHRHGYAGYSDDMSRVLASFITSNGKRVGYAYHLADMLEMVRDKTMPGDVQKEAQGLLEAIQEPTDKGAQLRSLLAAWYLLGSPASALVNMTQTITMSLPWLSQHGKKGFSPTQAAQELAKAYKLTFSKNITNKQLAADLARAEQDGTVDSNEVFHLYTEAMKPLIAKLGSGNVGFKVRAFMTLWGAPFAIAEKINRKATFIAAWNMAKEKGMADPFAFAEKAVIETQSLHSKINRPNWARGTIGGVALLFRQFTISYIEMLARMARSGPEGRKAALLALSILFFFGGLAGLPGEDDLLDLIDTAAQSLFGKAVISKMEIRNALADTLGKELGAFVNSGISAYLPLDVSGRMGMGNIVPGSAILKPSERNREREAFEAMGVVGSFGKSLLDMSEAMLAGDLRKGMRVAAPKGIGDIIKGVEMAVTGEARDNAGRKIIDVTPTDAMAQIIGFNPRKKAEASSKISDVTELIAYHKKVEANIVSQWARGMIDRDRDAIVDARERVKDWNENNPDLPIRVTPQQVLARAKNMRSEREGRVTKTAPPEIRSRVKELAQ